MVGYEYNIIIWLLLLYSIDGDSVKGGLPRANGCNNGYNAVY